MAPPCAQTTLLFQAQFVDDGQHHRRERLGDLDRADVADRRPARGTAGLVSSRRIAGAGASPGSSGRPAATARRDHPQVGQAGGRGGLLRW